ncbi:SWIM zinc finger family protein [Halorientalis brevis]|uniref:SWIM zinc finger family protein n=1 Tax=Halorientalis brevis TaxID=1126241 RepID=A0ABD6C8U4_9EURY|nr:SWIM zinc finger family protein [Halorientalis brevis]
MHPLDRLDFPTRVAKRAQYEAFEFAVIDDGVRVRNCSHADPADHEYTVTVQDGLPTACTCPADERFDGACKHRVAVAIRSPVLDAARTTPVAADGGQASDGSENAGPEIDCDCGELPGEFPCWECVRTGRKAMPE